VAVNGNTNRDASNISSPMGWEKTQKKVMDDRRNSEVKTQGKEPEIYFGVGMGTIRMQGEPYRFTLV